MKRDNICFKKLVNLSSYFVTFIHFPPHIAMRPAEAFLDEINSHPVVQTSSKKATETALQKLPTFIFQIILEQ